MMSVAFSRLGEDTAQSILLATSNPFVGLFIGLLMTAIIQSSSSSTSMAVAAVASGSITFEHAIPIVMGANIGTTLTSTLVALSYITKRKEFERAIAAGTVHDLYNIFCVILLFPLEYYFSVLSKASAAISNLVYLSPSPESSRVGGLATLVFEPVSTYVYELTGSAFFLLFLSFMLILGSVKLISGFLYRNIVDNLEKHLDERVFSSRFQTFAIGTLITTVVQSSSLTTSLIVPLVATNKVKLTRAFQFVLGANVGTTITALIAAAFRSEEAIAIAVAHLLFNLFGCAIFLSSKVLAKIVVSAGEWLGEVTAERRIIGFLYILIVFFIIPFTLIYFNRS